ncbi:hypothetical protein [Clostridium botulinum]
MELGYVWMFPYHLGQNGGGAFLIPYLFFVILLGTTVIITELCWN